MDTRDFCNWFQGALSMATAEDGSVSFTKLQADKVKENLTKALEPKTVQTMLNRPEGTRC